MNKAPAFLFYPKDFLTDEKVAVMSNQELGCYMKLLCYAWQEGSIPAEIGRIARLCGEPVDVMREIWEQISTCFTAHTAAAGRLVQARMEQERDKQFARREERSASGKKGAEQRKINKLHQQWEPAGNAATGKPAANSSIAVAIASAIAEEKTFIPEGMNGADSAARVAAGRAAAARQTAPQPEGDLFLALQGVPPAESQSVVPLCPQQQIVDLYHKAMPTNPKVVLWNKEREALLRARWREMATTANEQLGGGYRTMEEGVAWWKTFLGHCAKSQFLTGKSDQGDRTPFLATLEWIVRPRNFAKIIEGVYHRN